MNHAHVIAYHGADSIGEGICTGDGDVLRVQVLHFTQVHAEDSCTDDGIIGTEGHIGDGVALSVEYAHEHAAHIALVCQIHLSDGLPFNSGKVEVFCQGEAGAVISACTAVIHGRGKGQQLLCCGNPVRIFSGAGSAGIGAAFGKCRIHAQRKRQGKQDGKQFFH